MKMNYKRLALLNNPGFIELMVWVEVNKGTQCSYKAHDMMWCYIRLEGSVRNIGFVNINHATPW